MTQLSEVRRLHPHELRQRLETADRLALLDVREDDERRIGAIDPPEGVVDLHVPIGQVPDRIEAIRTAGGGRALIVYCHHGIRSLATARWLVEQGFSDVANLEGGIDAWSRTVDPAVPRY